MDIPPNPIIFRFIRLGVLLLLAYGLFHTVTSPNKPATHPAQSAANARAKDCNCPDTNPFSNFSALAFPIIPTITPALRIEDTHPGTGNMAFCGQQATLRYSLATQNKAEIYNNLDSKDAAETFRLGSDQLLPGMDRGIIGMQEGGSRVITLPPSLAFGGVSDVHVLRDNAKYKFESPSDPLVANVSLLSVSPPIPPSLLTMRTLGGMPGTGNMALCGDTVLADITLWKLDGTLLFTTFNKAPVSITLGAGQAPLGIEFGIFGLRENGQRTVIIPPAYSKPLNPSASPSPSVFPSISWPDHEIVLGEIGLRPFPKPSAK